MNQVDREDIIGIVLWRKTSRARQLSCGQFVHSISGGAQQSADKAGGQLRAEAKKIINQRAEVIALMKKILGD